MNKAHVNIAWAFLYEQHPQPARCDRESDKALATCLIVDNHWCANAGELVEPSRVGCRDVDAAMTHRLAKVVMPVSAMNGISAIEVHGPRYVGKIIPWAGHRGRGIFCVDGIAPGDGWRSW